MSLHESPAEMISQPYVPSLARQRCFNHGRREAVARCPQCGHYYCRECITEHDDRVICDACLKKLAPQPFTQRRAFIGILKTLQGLLGVLTVWFFFYVIGEGLLSLLSSFYEGTLWRTGWLERK